MSAPRPTRRYVLRETDVPAYSPANHEQTFNRRVIGPDTVGAKFVEVLVGTLAPGASAESHAHPGIEQIVHCLEGTAEATIDGETITVSPGDWLFLPEGSFHGFRVTSATPMRIIVIYSPPYGERKDATRLRDAVTSTHALT